MRKGYNRLAIRFRQLFRIAYGSFARNENHHDSDLDILVEFRDTVNLLDIIGAEMKLSELLNLKVDLVTKKAIPPRLAPHIDKDLQKIFHEEG